MALLIAIVGIVLLIVGIRDKGPEAVDQVKTTVSNTNVLLLVYSIGLIGALGFIKQLRPVSRSLLVLIFVVLTLNVGPKIFDRLTEIIRNIGK
jgi:Sec-independent protein translocase protein TatA